MGVGLARCALASSRSHPHPSAGWVALRDDSPVGRSHSSSAGQKELDRSSCHSTQAVTVPPCSSRLVSSWGKWVLLLRESSAPLR